MRTPLTIRDLLDRAELVYGDRVGVVDEPDQPAASWGERHLRRDGRGGPGPRPPALDALGVAGGERVAIVSHNSARLLTSFFGVSGCGPDAGADQLPAERRRRSSYIVEHSGASVLLVDPELDDAAGRASTAKHRFVIGAETDAELFARRREPRAVGRPDEDATATINYTSGTTARPKGVQLTHRNAVAQRHHASAGRPA